jgi:dTDP-4-dehydrorhamnose 3,5-epimerase
MIFTQAVLSGVWKIGLQPHVDERGFFARIFCGDEFAAHGLPSIFEQSSLSRNTHQGTIRGMHFQSSPHGEEKFVRCVRGAIFDVVIDIREGSPTRGAWIGETLNASDGNGLYIPAGFAHGFQTLADDTDVLYQITPAFRPGAAKGVRWDDPAFGIDWPIPNPIVSERDRNYANWSR